MNIRNLILASGLAALASSCNMIIFPEISYDVISIEDETYICRQTLELAGTTEKGRRINLVTKQGKALSEYSGSSNTMQLYGPTQPLTYWQTAELTEECIRKFGSAEKATK